MNGWIKIHRKMMNHPMYFAEPFNRALAWIDLIMLANHKENFFYVRGNKVIVKRGQIGMSKENLAVRWKWSRGKVLRFLNDLEKEHQIAQQKNKLTSLISVVNYELYQTDSATDDAVNNTTDGQQTGQQTDTNKNVKNIKNEKEYIEGVVVPLSPPSDEDEKPKIEKSPFKEIVDAWNTTCISLPKVFVLSDSRKNKMRVRIEEMGGVEKAIPIFKSIFEKTQANPFLRGDKKEGWKASFDWLFENDKNWVKVWEGNYENKEIIQNGNSNNYAANRERKPDYSEKF